MASGRFIAYYRVSTSAQKDSGLSLEAQKKSVRDYLGSNGWEIVAEFTETESGGRSDRPQLTRAIDAAKRAKATLVIAKLDRLARNVHFISGLMESGIDFVAVDFPEANRLTIHILAAVAEHEREMISQRTKAALAAAKSRGIRLGSPAAAKGAALGVQARITKADEFAHDVAPIIDDIRRAGITSLSGIADALNARGVATARGGQWHASTVSNVLRRIEPDRG